MTVTLPTEVLDNLIGQHNENSYRLISFVFVELSRKGALNSIFRFMMF